MPQVQAMPKTAGMSKVEVVKTHIEVENQHDMEAMLATLVDEDPVRRRSPVRPFADARPSPDDMERFG